jgi:hypothetical protein
MLRNNFLILPSARSNATCVEALLDAPKAPWHPMGLGTWICSSRFGDQRTLPTPTRVYGEFKTIGLHS